MREPKDIKIGYYTLEELIQRHNQWIQKEYIQNDDKRLNLNNITLENIIFDRCNLFGAVITNCHIINCYFNSTMLNDSCFRKSILDHVSFSKSSLVNANFRDTNLICCKTYYTNFSCVDFTNAYFEDNKFNPPIIYGAALKNAYNMPNLSLACPTDGAFIGWKGVYDNETRYLVKLQIPASAKRVSGTINGRCRASKAKVLGIYTLEGKRTNLKSVTRIPIGIVSEGTKLEYIVGETVYPDSFDEDRWNECSHGIHFYINKEDAIYYIKHLIA